MTDKIYGQVTCSNGNTIGGLTLAQVEELAEQLDIQQCEVYDLTMDLAIAPKLIKDLVARIKELEAQVATQNLETKTEVSTSRSQPTS